ncbi:hypothetical protein [Streptomyces sp. NPDC050504]|uniref:hypothetical protein n=1 Tax=Streptomyces sp. NPDC050504 TaxID=3365618 RepID=UPI003798B18D
MSSHSAAELRSRYVEQVASELEENRRLQAELTKKVEVLRQEEALLTDILVLAERYEGFADPSRLPVQTQDDPAVTPANRDGTIAAAERPATPSGTSTPATGAKSRTRRTARGTSGEPLLGDLLMNLLGEHDEPRAAKELRDELLEKHPSRNPTPQVVRNALEFLVSKGRIQRHKQQRSVLYTLVTSPDTT